MKTTAVNHGAPIIVLDPAEMVQAVYDWCRTHGRPLLDISGVEHARTGTLVARGSRRQMNAVAHSLLMANMNSIPLDWAARLSVGGTALSQFIVKQLPLLPPEAHLKRLSGASTTFVEMIVPRVLELTYTAHDLASFAEDIGYDGPPFVWDEERRRRLKCELDAIFAHMYGLKRDELEWMLDAQYPSVSFPTLKRQEEKDFGEYRTKRLVLEAYDRFAAVE